MTFASAYLSAVDAALPGLVTGLHLTGSIALGDYRPGLSDIDGLAVISRPLTPADAATLRTLHEKVLAPAPHVDLVYLTADEVAAQPSAAQVVPHSLQRIFTVDEECFQLNPVLWAELAGYSVSERGNRPAVAVDQAALIAWNRENLVSYWGAEAARGRSYLADVDENLPIVQVAMLCWAVLGPPRLHYTIATGGIASKTAAGVYAIERFPAYKDLIELCLQARAGETVSATIADAKRANDFTDAVIADALDLP